MRAHHQVQVGAEHYGRRYDHKHRWLGYFYQISTVLDLAPHAVLEVGPGNGLVASYLRDNGVQVTTADIDRKLKPTVVASITDLPFEQGVFDVSMACEVLEHLPFDDFPQALRELARVSKKYVLVSLPDARRTLAHFVVKLPFLPEWKFRGRLMKGGAHVFDGQHYWEIGKRGFPPSRVRDEIRNAGLTITKEFAAEDAPFYHFFLMEKRAA